MQSHESQVFIHCACVARVLYMDSCDVLLQPSTIDQHNTTTSHWLISTGFLTNFINCICASGGHSRRSCASTCVCLHEHSHLNSSAFPLFIQTSINRDSRVIVATLFTCCIPCSSLPWIRTNHFPKFLLTCVIIMEAISSLQTRGINRYFKRLCHHKER